MTEEGKEMGLKSHWLYLKIKEMERTQRTVAGMWFVDVLDVARDITLVFPHQTLRVHRVQNINTFLIVSCTLFALRTASIHCSLDYKVSKAFHGDAGPCWLQCFPQLCQDGWRSFVWWTILNKLLRVEKPSSVAVLGTCCAWHLLLYPVGKALTMPCESIRPPWTLRPFATFQASNIKI